MSAPLTPSPPGMPLLPVHGIVEQLPGVRALDGVDLDVRALLPLRAADLVTTVAKGEDPTLSFAEGPQITHVLDAVGRNAAAHSPWTEIRP